jgi:hypothetical protein
LNEGKMVTSDSRKELFLVEAIVTPIFELRVVTVHKNCYDTLPTRFSEAIDTIVNIKGDISATNISSNSHMRQILGFVVINSPFQEHVCVSNGQVSLRMDIRHNNDRSWCLVSLFKVLLLKWTCDLIQ